VEERGAPDVHQPGGLGSDEVCGDEEGCGWVEELGLLRLGRGGFGDYGMF